MKLCKKIIRIASLAFIILMLVSSTVLAAYSYYATVQVQETGSNSYDYLPFITDIDNDYLADNGYISLTGLDTRILSGSTELEHLVVDDKVLFIIPSVEADSTGNYRYTLGNSLQGDFPIITGVDGYITIADDANLELADDFELEWDGYVDTTYEAYKRLIYKPGAIEVSITAAEEITSGIISSEDRIDVTPAASGAWTDVDVSAYVGSSITGVILECVSAGALAVGVREDGSTDTYTRDLQGHQTIMVGVNSNIFEAYLEDHTNSTIYLIGYAKYPWYFKTNWVDLANNDQGAWTEDDITAITNANADIALIYIEGEAGATKEWGLRASSGAQDIKYDCLSHQWNFGVVPLDSEQKYDYYNEDLDLDFLLIGYGRDVSGYVSPKPDKEPSAAGVWEDIDCSSEASGAQALVFELGSAAARDYSIIHPSDIDSTYEEYYNHAFVITFCDDSATVQAKVSDIAASEFFLTAWIDTGLYRIPQAITYSKSVKAINVAAGEHNVETWADGVKLYISIDSAVAGDDYDEIVLAGATVTDTTQIWLLDTLNVLPYMNYYKHTTAVGGSSLKAWYQPISMIVGTNLDDREGTDIGETGTAEEDGVITWGSNPADLSATVGSLVSSSQPEISPASEEEAVDIVPEGEVPVEGGVVNVGKLLNNPLYFIVEIASEYTGYTEEQIWFLGATLIILLGMGISAVKVPNHLLLAGTVGLVLGGFFTAMEIYQWWMMLIFGFVFLMSILMERKPVL